MTNGECHSKENLLSSLQYLNYSFLSTTVPFPIQLPTTHVRIYHSPKPVKPTHDYFLKLLFYNQVIHCSAPTGECRFHKYICQQIK